MELFFRSIYINFYKAPADTKASSQEVFRIVSWTDPPRVFLSILLSFFVTTGITGWQKKEYSQSQIKKATVPWLHQSIRRLPMSPTHIVLPRSVLAIQQRARSQPNSQGHIAAVMFCASFLTQKRRTKHQMIDRPCPLDFYREHPCNVNTPQSVVRITCYRKKPTVCLCQPHFTARTNVGPEKEKNAKPKIMET